MPSCYTILDTKAMPTYSDILRQFNRAFRQAQRCRAIRDATVMLVATASRAGKPSLRAVLLKGMDRRGFVFYTNFDSRKGRLLKNNPHAALTFLWHPIGWQVHIEGRVKRVSKAEADAYWATRPRESKVGAWASLQSRKLNKRQTLISRFKACERRFHGKVVPRPAVWSGFRVIPSRIEFWKAAPHRLHYRWLYEKRGSRWIQSALYP